MSLDTLQMFAGLCHLMSSCVFSYCHGFGMLGPAKEGTLCQSRGDGWPLQVTCQDLGRHHAARRSQSPGGEAGFFLHGHSVVAY